MIVVADASPLIALALCDSLTLLDQLFEDVKVATAVYDEVTLSGKPHSNSLKEYLSDKLAGIEFDDNLIEGASLGKGEIHSIALYRYLNADYLLIDEKVGRRIARLNHVNVIGSLGVLILAKKRQLIPTIKPQIELLKASQIHFSQDLLDHALLLAEE